MLADKLKAHEAWRARPYDDATGRQLEPGMTLQGVATIGYGFTYLEPEEGDFILQRRIASLYRELSERVPYWDELNDARKEALINMAFNLGVSGLMSFKRMHRYAANQDWWGAKLEALNSKWANQVGHRAIELADVLYTGEWNATV